MTERELSPPVGERLIVVGKTGSGKSVVCRLALAPFLPEHHVVIMDTKESMSPFDTHTARKDGATFIPYKKDVGIFHNPADLMNGGKTLVKDAKRIRIYQPSPEHLANPESWEVVFAWVYREKNRVLYIDEAYDVCHSATSYPHTLRAIYSGGRSRNITVIAGVQRPKDVPNFMFSESGRVALFQCNLSDDRKKIAGFTNPKLLQNVADYWDGKGKNCHLFWFYDGIDATLTKVNLNG